MFGIPALDGFLDSIAGPADQQQEALANLPPHIQQFGDQIRQRKEMLKSQGVSNKQIKADPQVIQMIQQLDQMKAQAGLDPKTNLPWGEKVEKKEKAPPPVSDTKPLPPDLQQYGYQIRDLKNQLKNQGYSDEQIKNNQQMQQMVNRLNNEMRNREGPKQPPSPTKVNTSLPPDLQNLQRQLNELKDNLRSQGMKGDQLVNHPRVAEMQNALNQQMRARGISGAAPNSPGPSYGGQGYGSPYIEGPKGKGRGKGQDEFSDCLCC